MGIATVNGTSLHYDVHGSGPALVLVHGSPADSSTWDAVVPALAATFTVVTYDRRGFGQNQSGDVLPSVQRHVDDLAALIGHLGIGPAHVVGNSGGAHVAFWLAIRRPQVVARVSGHEPGFLLLLLADPAYADIVDETRAAMEEVVTHLDASDRATAMRIFVDRVVAQGMWDLMPEEMRRRVIENAPAFQAELRAFDAMYVDPDALAEVPVRLLLTSGTDTSPVFSAVAERLAASCPNLERHTFATGHVPHLTEPAEFVAVTTRWLTS